MQKSLLTPIISFISLYSILSSNLSFSMLISSEPNRLILWFPSVSLARTIFASCSKLFDWGVKAALIMIIIAIISSKTIALLKLSSSFFFILAAADNNHLDKSALIADNFCDLKQVLFFACYFCLHFHFVIRGAFRALNLLRAAVIPYPAGLRIVAYQGSLRVIKIAAINSLAI